VYIYIKMMTVKQCILDRMFNSVELICIIWYISFYQTFLEISILWINTCRYQIQNIYKLGKYVCAYNDKKLGPLGNYFYQNITGESRKNASKHLPWPVDRGKMHVTHENMGACITRTNYLMSPITETRFQHCILHNDQDIHS